MTRLERVIEDVKESRKSKYRAWIFDDNGKIKDDVFCGEVLELLEELKDYEIKVTDKWLEDFINRDDVKGNNTYNWGANISNDLNFHIKETKNECIIAIMVHLAGDIRGNYTEHFAVKFDSWYEFLELESMLQHKSVTDTMSADIYLMRELYTVYDYEKDEEVGEFYELELADLLAEIRNQEEN